LADYKEDDRVWSISPIFMLIAYYLGFTNRKRNYFEEKTAATLKSKQTLIATVGYHLLPVASLLTPLIFHYPLPLNVFAIRCCAANAIFCCKVNPSLFGDAVYEGWEPVPGTIALGSVLDVH
jgi:hypothetical protein